jgi:hypothetical protein
VSGPLAVVDSASFGFVFLTQTAFSLSPRPIGGFVSHFFFCSAASLSVFRAARTFLLPRRVVVGAFGANEAGRHSLT